MTTHLQHPPPCSSSSFRKELIEGDVTRIAGLDFRKSTASILSDEGLGVAWDADGCNDGVCDLGGGDIGVGDISDTGRFALEDTDSLSRLMSCISIPFSRITLSLYSLDSL